MCSLVELDRQECLELVGRGGIGRVVLSVDAIPIALPVNLALLHGDVVFDTDEGSKLDAAVRGNVISVEADSLDRDDRRPRRGPFSAHPAHPGTRAGSRRR